MSTKTALLPLTLLSLLGGCSAVNAPGNPADALPLTDHDTLLADRAVQSALETQVSGVTLSWRNSGNRHFGSVTPLRTYKAKNGYYCREYRETVTIAGRTRGYRNTACRDSDGVWKSI